ncbi:MAG: 23S rRNA (adenine(1618)-N(6))-methyltransferase RlmF [Nonlabens sp.]
MHQRNIHRYGYDFKKLATAHPPLEKLIVTSPAGTDSIDFSDPQSILEFNTALLKHHYKIKSWKLPEQSLYPPIPSRADYLHHIADLVGKGDKKGLDIGCGASAIYCLLGNSIYGYHMVGVDIDETSVTYARKNTQHHDDIEIRLQTDRGNILKKAIPPGEKYDFTICNPPFYASEEEAIKANFKKQLKLGTREKSRNFSGEAHELWCNGGEQLFIRRLIKESKEFKDQVQWFTCLVSQQKNLAKLQKQLSKLNATHQVVTMEVGNKKSRFIAWTFKP